MKNKSLTYPTMKIMLANHASFQMGVWLGKGYPVAWLIGPKAWWKTKLHAEMPYALDNDAFSAWTSGEEWNEPRFYEMLSLASISYPKPSWVVVPDVVGDKYKTLESWHQHASRVAEFKIPLAFAVQDGMTKKDVPHDADVVFVGGTDAWKWRNLKEWTDNFDRVHVGRVNSLEKVQMCYHLGCESIDGTGWFRDGTESARFQRLLRYFHQDQPKQTTIPLRDGNINGEVRLCR